MKWNEDKTMADISDCHLSKSDLVLLPDGNNKETWDKIDVNQHCVRQGIWKGACFKGKKIDTKAEILFVGRIDQEEIYGYRTPLVNWLKEKYGDKFLHLGNSSPDEIRGEDLNNLISSVKIVIGDSVYAPYYWSNRIYETIGRGGFILHPYIEGLENEYEIGKHFDVYKTLGSSPTGRGREIDFDDLEKKINYYLDNDEIREKISQAGMEHTIENHTLENRAKQVIDLCNFEIDSKIIKKNVKKVREKLRVGSLVRATNQGLGVLTESFYKSGIITDVLIKGHPNNRLFPSYPERFDNSLVIGDGKEDRLDRTPIDEIEVVNSLLDKIDILLLFETPYYRDIIDRARDRGVKVILMPMYECTEYPLYPDFFLCPSLLDLEYYKHMYENIPSKFIQIPVDVEWKQRTKVKRFIHNAGNGSGNDRNGTKTLLDSLQYIKSPIELLIRTQQEGFEVNDERVEVFSGQVPYNELWKDGDVFIFTERFNGLSLPLQEAYASGMLVISGNRFPINTWLPTEHLVDVKDTQVINGENGLEVESSNYDSKKLAEVIDSVYGTDITEYSNKGKEWNERNSWNGLKEDYLNLFKEIINE